MDAQHLRSSDERTQVPKISVSRTSTASLHNPAPVQDAPEQIRTSSCALQYDKSSAFERRPSPSWRPWRRKHTGKRDRTPDLQWKIRWSDHCFPRGRVLIIDYKGSDSSTPGGKRHIQIGAQELQSLEELRHFYGHSKKQSGTALRVIHVQNAEWAASFLLRKFNINHPNEMLGMPDFGKWVQAEQPRQRNGKPFPDGRSWRGQADPWRNIARTAFGLDYLKTFETEAASHRTRAHTVSQPTEAKLMHLNAYEDDARGPHGYDVSVQRLSVYIQRSLGPHSYKPADVGMANPYARVDPPMHVVDSQNPEQKIILEALDNRNTIIIFESSPTARLIDCLVKPRDDLEKRWRRLSFYLRKEDLLNDTRLAAQCTNIILSDLFHQVASSWELFLNAAADHVAILEDKIYDNPADESRAPELWTNQASWLKVDKILYLHSDIAKSMQTHMRELGDYDDDDEKIDVEWLNSTPAEYEKLLHDVSEALVQPTNNLSDLMYKSVGIRDSRQSLQLGLSMWRLSWITFIFLPLTFIVSFFGMNVDILANYPSIGWYFLAAGILMIFVLALWYCVKHSLQRSRQTPYQRGMYEALFQNLEDQYPQLWTTAGAANDVHPSGLYSRLKWRLLKRWFAPEKTIYRKLFDSLAPGSDSSELGAWDTVKRYLLRRWLPQINEAQEAHDDIALAETGESPIATYEAETIDELLKSSTRLAMADAEPTAVAPLTLYGLRPLNLHELHSNTSPRNSEDRPSSRGSSGMMIEERNLSDSESEAGEGSSSEQTKHLRRASS